MAFRPTGTPAGHGRAVTLHWQNLVVYRKELADRIVEQAGPQEGHVRILLSELDEATRNELLAELPFLAKMKAPDALADSEKMGKIMIDQAVRAANIKNDNDAGLARLTEWGKTGLLEDTPANAAAIQQWLESNVNGYLNPSNIDAAISILGPKGTNVLTWRKPAPPTPPAPAAPAEVLVKLSDDSYQLPLDKPVPRNATVEQAKDYLARVRAQQPYARSGSFGTRF